MRKAVAILFFLMLVDDGEITQTIYALHMFAPFTWVDTIFFDPLPIKVRLWDLCMLGILLASGAKGPRVMPMRNAILLAVGTTIFMFLLGMLRGGSSRFASWQVYLMLTAPLVAFTVAATHTKVEHYRSLGKWIIAAAFYRAVMCLIFYFSYARSADPVPPVMTTHGDTVLWILAISIIAVNFLEERTTWSKVLAFVVMPVIFLAVHFNNRRLAWVSLALSMGSLYFLLPASKAKRRLKRVAIWFVPVIVGYVVVGWGRTERIFKPLAALSSVSSKPDGSTLARNVENLSLIATASYSPLTGSGWGHAYVELSNKYTIATAMELWPYIPHNSILGLFAYTGVLGVLGYWMMFPIGMFLHARVARLSRDPHTRTVATVSVMATLISMAQMFGDMGIFSLCTMYFLAAVWGGAMRLPLIAGVWGPSAAAQVARAAVPAPAPAPAPAPGSTAAGPSSG